MSTTSSKLVNRTRRHGRIRAKVAGTAERPRLAVFKSNRAIYAQLIDDEAGKTLASADSRKAKGKTGVERAKEVGATIADLAKKAKIESVVFDRGGYKYQGSLVTLADAAREAGLKF